MGRLAADYKKELINTLSIHSSSLSRLINIAFDKTLKEEADVVALESLSKPLKIVLKTEKNQM